MPPDVAALSRYQIQRFFEKNVSVTQLQCNAEAERITSQAVTTTESQGGSNYTVEGGELIVQFRIPSSTLHMNLLRSVEQAYRGFVPHHEYRGKLGQVSIYVMNNIGGTCMYLARDELQSNNCALLRLTIDDYAKFFASAYHNTPVEMTRRDPDELLREYSNQLQQLRESLPSRFHSLLDELIPQLPSLFTEDWPLVPNHTDLHENNIHVDPATGRLTGICDWRETEVSPFGMSLGGLEVMLGFPVTSGGFWRYHPNHQELWEFFWTRFYEYLGGALDEQKRRVKAARLIGLFLAYGFEGGKPATEESEDLQILGLIVLE